MAKRGRPKRSETTVAQEAPKPAKKTGTAKTNETAVKKPISLDDLNQRELARFRKELKEEITKDVLRTVVNPLVKEFQKIDK
ncbi:MAG: hypothetical protein ACOWWR_16180 [Eubacteriales bacterium]